jgi:hypothetical protein
VIQEGEITFTGQSSLQPVLNIVAAYKFRSTTTPVTRWSSPSPGGWARNITFVLDDVAIEQTDAVSYLLFNRGSGELSQGEQSLLSEQYGSGGLAFGMLASAPAEQRVQHVARPPVAGRGWSWAATRLEPGFRCAGQVPHHPISISATSTSSTSGARTSWRPTACRWNTRINRWLFLQAVQGSESDTGLDLIYKWEK